MKYNYKDINILKPGKQIRAVIIEKYGSVEKFADILNRYPSSIYRYLRSSDCGSHIFKGILVKYLDIGYDDIVIPVEEQIKNFVSNIMLHIKEYSGKDDLETLEKLRKICLKYNLETQHALMQRNIALYHYYNNSPETAVEMLKTAIEVLETKGLQEHIFMCLCDLGLVYYYKNNLKKSKIVYGKAENMIGKVNLQKDLLYLFNYRYGILLTNMNKHNESIEYLKKSLKYATDYTKKGNSYTGIGTVYLNKKSYNISLKSHFEALNNYNIDDYVNISRTYNNIADAYLCYEEYDLALTYVNKALDLTRKNNISKYFMYLQTYTQILIKLDNAEEAIDELISILECIDDLYLFQNRIISAIRIILDYAVVKDKHSIINRLELEINHLVLLMDSDSQYSKDMKSMLYEIIIYRQRR